MTWLQVHYSQVLAISAIVQAGATMILVVVTFAYVLFTRSLAKKAQLQATAAQAQADAAREAIDRAYEDGVRQQAQLVQRQAILAARAELGTLLSRSYEWLTSASSLASTVAGGDFAAALHTPDDASLAYCSKRCDALLSADEACDMDYLDDYAGAFPFGDVLAMDFYLDGHVARSALMDVSGGVMQAMGGQGDEAEATQAAARHLLETANLMRTNLLSLRQAVITTGYARAFGALPLDSPDLTRPNPVIEIRNGEWWLPERPDNDN